MKVLDIEHEEKNGAVVVIFYCKNENRTTPESEK
jgi:hypothetical protein